MARLYGDPPYGGRALLAALTEPIATDCLGPFGPSVKTKPLRAEIAGTVFRPASCSRTTPVSAISGLDGFLPLFFGTYGMHAHPLFPVWRRWSRSTANGSRHDAHVSTK